MLTGKRLPIKGLMGERSGALTEVWDVMSAAMVTAATTGLIGIGIIVRIA
jgi:hypothetical protein